MNNRSFIYRFRTPIIVALAAILAVSAALVGVRLFTKPVPETATSNTIPTMERRIAGEMTARGDLNAPVVMVEYGDFRCPFCGLFARDSMPAIIEKYIDTGLMRFEWRDAPFFGSESYLAAVAARAAGRQGLYWEYHTELYARAPERGRLDITPAVLGDIAEAVGVPDMAQFAADLQNEAVEAGVQRDFSEAVSLGINSVPVFLVNGTPLIGAQPLEVFEQVIEQQLEAAKRR